MDIKQLCLGTFRRSHGKQISHAFLHAFGNLLGEFSYLPPPMSLAPRAVPANLPPLKLAPRLVLANVDPEEN